MSTGLHGGAVALHRRPARRRHAAHPRANLNFKRRNAGRMAGARYTWAAARRAEDQGRAARRRLQRRLHDGRSSRRRSPGRTSARGTPSSRVDRYVAHARPCAPKVRQPRARRDARATTASAPCTAGWRRTSATSSIALGIGGYQPRIAGHRASSPASATARTRRRSSSPRCATSASRRIRCCSTQRRGVGASCRPSSSSTTRSPPSPPARAGSSSTSRPGTRRTASCR